MTRTNRQKAIRKRQQEGRKVQQESGCPTPSKQRYQTADLAYRHALKSSRGSLATKVYKCKCGGWHVTTKKERI